MREKLSVRQRLVCAMLVVCTGILYLGFCVFAVRNAWQRKEAELVPASFSFHDVTLILAAVPFGYVPGFKSILIAPIVNALFWGGIAGVVYVRFVRRKIA